MMSDQHELKNYKFDKVGRFLRCTYTGGERPHGVSSIEYIRDDDYDNEWYNTKTWQGLSDRDACLGHIETALLQHEYNEALERSKQSDNPPLPVPTQLSDSIHEVIRQAVIASNVETYKRMDQQVSGLTMRIAACEKTESSIWSTIQRGDGPCLKE